MNTEEYDTYKKEVYKTYLILDKEIERLEGLNNPSFNHLIKELKEISNGLYLDHFCNYN